MRYRCLLACLLAPSLTAAPITWTGPTNGDQAWNNPTHWSTGTVPGPGAEVTVSVTGSLRIVMSPGLEVTVARLNCTNGLVLDQASLTVTAGLSDLSGPVAITNAAIVANNAGTGLTLSGEVNGLGASFYALKGAQLAVNGLNRYVGGNLFGGSYSLQADGAGSVLDLTEVTELSAPTNQFAHLDITALNGGRVELPGVSAPTGATIGFLADGTNSVVNLQSLESIAGPTLEARRQGSINCPQLSQVEYGTLILSDTAFLPTTQVASAKGASLIVRGGAIFAFPSLRTYDAGDRFGWNPSLRAEDLGSKLELSGITNLVGATGQFGALDVMSRAGGEVILSNLQQMVVGFSRATADGVGSRIDFARLTRLEGQQWEAKNGGQIFDPALVQSVYSGLILRDTAQLGLNKLTNLTGSAVLASGGATMTFPLVTVFEGGPLNGQSLSADNPGSTIVFPALTRFVGTTAAFRQTEIQALHGGSIQMPLITTMGEGASSFLSRDAGSRIELPNLTAVLGTAFEAAGGGSLVCPKLIQVLNSALTKRGPTSVLPTEQITSVGRTSLTAAEGAILSFPALTQYDDGSTPGNWRIDSVNAGSRIDFPALTRFAGPLAQFSSVEVEARAGGIVRMPTITTLGEGSATFRASDENSRFELPNLVTLTGGWIEARAGGAIVSPKLTELANALLTKDGPTSSLGTENIRRMTRTSLHAQGGASLVFPGLTEYDAGTAPGSWTLDAFNPGTVIEFPALTRFTGALAQFSTVTVRVSAGARMKFPKIVSLGEGAALFQADGTQSLLELPSLSSIFGFEFEVRGSSAINCPKLTELANASLSLTGPASFFPTAKVTAVSRTSLFAMEGAVLAFPSLKLYDGGTLQGGFRLQASGSGSVLDLSAVSDFRGVSAAFSSVEVLANSGGSVALGGVRSLDQGNAAFRASGVGSRIDLGSTVSAISKTFEVRDGAALDTSRLLQIDRGTILLVGPGNSFPLGQLEALTGSFVQSSQATVNLFSIRDIQGSTFDTPKGGQVHFPPAANLRVTEILAPPAALGGAPVTLVWEVKNDSANRVAGTRHDGVALRRAGSPDVLLGTIEVPNNLPAEGSQRYTNSVIIPSGLTGVWQFVVTADAGFDVYEGDFENDNTLVDTNPIGLSSPDLVVTAADPSVASTLFGTAFDLRWVVTNQGTTNAPTLWEDEVLLSTHQTDFSAAVSLGSFAAPRSLKAGESYTNLTRVTAPLLSTLPPGKYFVAVVTDARDRQFEANDANNLRTTPLVLAYPPLPDLAVVSVTAPEEAVPGQTITIQYVVTNRGPVTAIGPWVEAVWLGSATHPGSAATALAASATALSLPPGGSQLRSQQLVLPAQFIPGDDWRFSVTVDRDGAIVESDLANNTASANRPTAVRAALTLSVPQTTIPENAVPNAMIGQVIRNGDLNQALEVNLTSSKPGQLAVPTVVGIPAGQASAQFPLTVRADGLATPDQTVELIAAAAGRLGANARITVRNTDQPQLTLEFGTPSVVEGRTVSARVTRNGFLDQPLTLTLGSSSPSRLLPPAIVTLPPGVAQADMAFVALDNLLLEPVQTVTASVGAAGFPPTSVTLTIVDDDLPTLTFSVAETKISEAAGPLATTARIRRDRNLNAALIVRITSSDPQSIQVPESVLLPAGQTEIDFPVGVVNNSAVDGPREVTLSAVATYTTTGEPVGPSVIQALQVTDDDGPTLSLTLARKLVGPGLNPATTITVRRNTGTNTPLAISLSSSDPLRARLPASLTLNAGATEAVVDIATSVGGVPQGREQVTFTATAAGFSPGTASLTVSDLQRPDLVVTQITAPQAAVTKAQASLGWQVRNQGLAVAKGQLRQQVYLSKDPTLDADDPMVAEQVLDGELPPDLSFTFVRTIFLPGEPGDYWVFVRTDADNAFVETLEDNNLTRSSQPIRISPAYSATEVSVDIVTGRSGQPVEIRGRLVRTGSNEPAAFEVAAIHVVHDDFDRVLGALSDADGRFSATFRSGATEVGVFDVAVGHPEAPRPRSQVQFTLVGFAVESPGEVSWTTESGTTFEKRLEIGGRSTQPLTDVKATFINLPPGVTGTAESLSPILLPGKGGTIAYTLATTPTLAGRFQFSLRLTSAEGAQLDVPFTLEARPARPVLVVTPNPLIAGMVRGRQSQVEFAVTNLGYAATGPLTLALPALPWLASATVLPAPSLAPGESTVFRLLLTPADDLPLTVYTGELGVTSANTTVRVPCRFRAVSEALGDLEVTTEDEYTYYAAGAPRVTNALVQLLDPFDQSKVVRELRTDAAGFAAVKDVPEGSYILRVTAPKHTRRELRVDIAPGLTRETKVLLPAETVVYEWKVQAIEIPDSYRFTIDAKFESNVPFPVVTADPLLVPLVFPGEITQTSITITNHGLIAAKGIRIRARSTQTYLITPLFTDVGDLPAHSSITVPVSVQLQPDLDADFVSRLQQQGRWPQPGADLQPTVFGGMETHAARLAARATPASHSVRPAGLGLAAAGAGAGGKDCEKPSLDILYFVVCGPDGVLHTVSIDLRPVTMLKELNACLKAIAEGAGKGYAGIPKAICDCASSVAAGLGGSVPPELKCVCAFIGLDGGGIAECLCPEIPPGELLGVIGGGFGAFQPLAIPSGGGGRCQIIPTGGATGTGGGAVARAAQLSSPQSQLTQAGEGICATVKLRLEQDLVLTRTAIRATLGLENRLETPLSGVSFRILFFDRSGRNANSLFGGPPPVLSGLTALDGTGTLAPATTGNAEFSLVPSADAAPDSETPYTVGGELQYRDATGVVTVTLQPVPIKVLPQPRLQVDYFHQRDVFSDDPHTPEVEPSEPYTLAVLIRNVGQGPATSIRLTSAQPRIVDNEKGLLVDFQVVGTETFDKTGVRELSPSLTADFGDLPAGDVKVGRWLLKSSLQGLFTDYSARFEHLDGLGQRNLSLVDPDAVKIHELTHLIRDVRPGVDSLPEFLVNDDFATDLVDLPDSVYLSTGAVEPLTVVTEATNDRVPSATNLRVELSFAPTVGWAYVRVPDPQGPDGSRKFRLVRVLRSDGFNLPPENFWQTDRTFIGQGRKPLRENRLHLADVGSTGRYTLIYEPTASPNLTPPSSEVAELPPQAFADFPVTWTRTDAAGGPAAFDIYVSVDDAPFGVWLRDTELMGAFYPGTPGHRYAFYSVATDGAGNREAAPAAPDASTSTTLQNTPPRLTTVSAQTVTEGELFTLRLTALDSDVPVQTLEYELAPGAPLGLTLDAASGVLQWPTSEGNGPSTNPVTVIVRDHGTPSLSDTNSFVIQVLETNAAPSLADIPDSVIREGANFTFFADALDLDLPPNRLSFSLAPGAPIGATVNAKTGQFSWNPSRTQGPSTNQLTLIATDDGTPPRSQAQSFAIIVRDTEADFRLSIGRTNLFAGDQQSVGVHLETGDTLVTLEFELQADPRLLSELQLLPEIPGLDSAVLQPKQAGKYLASLTFVPDGLPALNDDILRLSFATTLGAGGVATLTPSAVLARDIEGRALRGAGVSGLVVVVADQPVLLAEPSSRMGITLFGRPGTQYDIDSRLSLDESSSWQPLEVGLSLTGEYRFIPLPGLSPQMYFRARPSP